MTPPVTWGELLDAVTRSNKTGDALAALGEKRRHPYPDRVEEAEAKNNEACAHLAAVCSRLDVSIGDAWKMVADLRRSAVPKASGD